MQTASPASPGRRSRWSRGERLIVAGILLFSLSILLPGIFWWRESRRVRMASHDVRTIHAAILRYFREYGSWPTPADSIEGDAHYGGRRPNAEVIRALRAMPAGGTVEDDLNPQRIVFLEVERYQRGLSGVDGDGSFLDPWGTPYQIALDADYDNSVIIAPNSPIRLSGVGCAVRSFGPDRKPDTRDDVKSWRREAHGAQTPLIE